MIEPGLSSVTLQDYNNDYKDVTVPLDSQLGVQENANRYYDRYQKLRRTAAALESQIASTREALEHLDSILQSLDEKLPVPVVYNTSGFEATDTLLKFEGKVQIWLPDLKYSDDTLALKYSNAYDYWNISRKAILEMFRQVGPYRLDADGIMQSGVIIRHLVLPGFMENTKRVIDWVAQTFKPGDVMFSLMHQYVPCGRANEYPELNRKVTPEEYKEVEDYLFDSGIEDGFVQEEESACGEFIPCFDGTGV
jgi:putative pyruvate formate lyase activating enzyme